MIKRSGRDAALRNLIRNTVGIKNKVIPHAALKGNPKLVYPIYPDKRLYLGNNLKNCADFYLRRSRMRPIRAKMTVKKRKTFRLRSETPPETIIIKIYSDVGRNK